MCQHDACRSAPAPSVDFRLDRLRNPFAETKRLRPQGFIFSGLFGLSGWRVQCTCSLPVTCKG